MPGGAGAGRCGLSGECLVPAPPVGCLLVAYCGLAGSPMRETRGGFGPACYISPS